MSEKLTLLATFRIDYVCDKCGTGTMEPTGIMLMCSPPKWPHLCTHCNAEDTFKVKYPSIGYRECPQ